MDEEKKTGEDQGEYNVKHIRDLARDDSKPIRVITNEELERVLNNLRHHPPFGTQEARYESIRGRARAFAVHLYERCPPSRELSLALTHLEDAVMWANAAIARNETDVKKV